MSVSVKLDSDKMILAMAKKQYNCARLANASGVSRATISYIRNGKTCKPDIAGKLAEALDLQVEELIETKKSKHLPPKVRAYSTQKPVNQQEFYIYYKEFRPELQGEF